jgi:hypothetical protein
MDNWQSTMRRRVSVHEQYSNITPWQTGETSDIVYQDETSTLTKLLMDRQYLHRSIWEGRSPNYFIEVKTTLRSLETPFFCSQKQFDMMENLQLEEEASDGIYLIARVYNLGASGIGLKLYLDPATLRKQDRLKFKADVYRVTPI